MDDYDFVSDASLRASLESDLAELRAARAGSLNKASTVLAGSITEALLVDTLLALGQTPSGRQPFEDMTLGALIGECERADVLSEQTLATARAVKEYRNLLHAGAQKRTRYRLDAPSAEVTVLLAEMVARDVREVRLARNLLTAEQFLNKVRTDSGFASIVGSLLSQLNPDDRMSLGVHLLPDAYRAAARETMDLAVDDWYEGQHELVQEAAALAARYADAHSSLMRFAEPEVVTAFAREVVRVCLEGTETAVTDMLDLAQGWYFAELDDEDRNVVVHRLLVEALDSQPDNLGILADWGRCLTPEVAEELATKVAYGVRDQERPGPWGWALASLYGDASPEARLRMSKAVLEWAEVFGETDAEPGRFMELEKFMTEEAIPF